MYVVSAAQNDATTRAARYPPGSARTRLGSANLFEFNATMHADTNVRGSALAEWTRDLFDLPHPTFRAERDVTVVEDTVSGRIVSALFVIPQMWSYAGVPNHAVRARAR